MNRDADSTVASEAVHESGPTGTASVFVVDDSIAMRAALKAECLPGCELPFTDEEAFYSAVEKLGQDIDLEKCKCILINAHCRLFESTRRAECLGLRIFDELILQHGENCPPLLLYSPMPKGDFVRLCDSQVHTTSTPWLELPRRLVTNDEDQAEHRSVGLSWDKVFACLPTILKGIDESIDACCQAWQECDKNALQQATAVACVERVHATIRHHFGPKCPAGRLLLGMEVLPAFDETARDGSRNALCKLAAGTSAPAEISRLSNRRYEQAREKAAVWYAPQCKIRDLTTCVHRKWKILLIDDESDSAGWQTALQKIFPNSHVESRNSLNGIMPDNLSEHDFVLLDYEFPNEEAKTAAVWLRHAKWQRPEVPVFMFTASDRVDIALWCLQHGASEYFVKEPYEPALRSSGEHLMRFLKIINQIDKTDPKQFAGSWSRGTQTTPPFAADVRRFIDAFRKNRDHVCKADRQLAKLRNENSDLPQGSLKWHLTQFAKALFQGYQDFYFARGTNADEVFGPRLQGASAARLSYHGEVFLELCAWLWWGECPHRHTNTHQQFMGQHGWKKAWRFLIEEKYRNCPFAKVAGLGRGGDARAAHWEIFRSGLGDTQLNKALKLIKPICTCIAGLPRVTSSIPSLTPSDEARVPEPRIKPPDPVSGSGKRRSAGHQQSQMLGAENLLRGLFPEGAEKDCNTFRKHLNTWASDKTVPSDQELLCKIIALLPGQRRDRLQRCFQISKKQVFRILLIDDQPWSTFATVLRASLLLLRHGRNIQTEAKYPKEIKPCRDKLESYELVLLDLDHGTTARPEGDKEGMKWLEELRSTGGDWGTPVAILSGRVDSLSLREALKVGAIDYIPKRVSGRDDQEALEYIIGRIINIFGSVPQLDRLQQIETRIRHDVWQTSLEFGNGIDTGWQRHLLGVGAEQVQDLNDVHQAIVRALMSAWCYCYLNVIRELRPDLWIADVFDNRFGTFDQDKVFLSQAVVDMGSALEPLILLTRACDQALYDATTPCGAQQPAAGRVAAGRVVTGADGRGGGWDLFRQLLSKSLAKKCRSIWYDRSDREHATINPPTTDECLEKLDRCVMTVIELKEKLLTLSTPVQFSTLSTTGSKAKKKRKRKKAKKRKGPRA